jgi:hypothetical protein
MGAALIVFVAPVVGIDSASAYNDVALAAILFAVFYLLHIWDQTRQAGLFIPIGLAAGFAFGTKYTAFLAVPYALGFLIWKLRGKSIGPVVIVGVTALAMIAPWLVKNWLIVQNPVSPFFNSWFPNPFVHIAFEEEYRWHMVHYVGLNNYWEIPLGVTVKGQVLGGIIGPLFLLAPLGLLALRSQQGRRLWFAAILFGSIYSTNVGTRFLIPALPYVALTMAIAFDQIKGLLPALALTHALLSWPDMIVKYSDRWVWRLEEIAWRPAFRIEGEESFLYRRWPPYGIARMIEKETPPNAKILSFNQIAEAYLTRKYLVVYQSAEGAVLGAIMQMPLAGFQIPSRISEFRFPKTNARGFRLRQTSFGVVKEAMWMIHEIRVRNGGTELMPDQNWRAEASAKPWDVGDMFDGNLATRWRSWETMKPGMYVQTNFGAAREIDSIAIEMAEDSVTAQVELDILTPDGKWTAMGVKPVQYEMAPPMGLRRKATQELKRRGVTHIMLQINEFGGEDYERRQEDWGITKVKESFGARLYKIE